MYGGPPIKEGIRSNLLPRAERSSWYCDRLAEIDRQIAECEQWGAKLTALNEERRPIRRNLGLE